MHKKTEEKSDELIKYSHVRCIDDFGNPYITIGKIYPISEDDNNDVFNGDLITIVNDVGDNIIICVSNDASGHGRFIFVLPEEEKEKSSHNIKQPTHLLRIGKDTKSYKKGDLFEIDGVSNEKYEITLNDSLKTVCSISRNEGGELRSPTLWQTVTIEEDKPNYIEYIRRDTAQNRNMTVGKKYLIVKRAKNYISVLNDNGIFESFLLDNNKDIFFLHSTVKYVTDDPKDTTFILKNTNNGKNKSQNVSETKPQIGENKMKFKKTTLIDDVDVQDLSDEKLIMMINTEETNAATLEKVETPSKYISKKIKRHRRNAAKLVDLLDARGS